MILNQVQNDGTAIVILMPPAVILTPPLSVIPELNSGQALTKVRIGVLVFLTQIPDQVRNDTNRNCHPDESQDLSLALTQIPDQVRNDGTAVILTLIAIVILTLFCHPDASRCHSDESQNRRFSFLRQIPDQVRNDGTVVILTLIVAVILTKVRIFFDSEFNSGITFPVVLHNKFSSVIILLAVIFWLFWK